MKLQLQFYMFKITDWYHLPLENQRRSLSKIHFVKERLFFFLTNKTSVLPLILWIGEETNMFLSSQMILDCPFTAYTSI